MLWLITLLGKGKGGSLLACPQLAGARYQMPPFPYELLQCTAPPPQTVTCFECFCRLSAGGTQMIEQDLYFQKFRQEGHMFSRMC